MLLYTAEGIIYVVVSRCLTTCLRYEAFLDTFRSCLKLSQIKIILDSMWGLQQVAGDTFRRTKVVSSVGCGLTPLVSVLQW
jgi:hypothetical protein